MIELLQNGIRDGDELYQKSQTPITEFSQALTMLEINGVIRALGTNQWTLSWQDTAMTPICRIDNY